MRWAQQVGTPLVPLETPKIASGAPAGQVPFGQITVHYWLQQPNNTTCARRRRLAALQGGGRAGVLRKDPGRPPLWGWLADWPVTGQRGRCKRARCDNARQQHAAAARTTSTKQLGGQQAAAEQQSSSSMTAPLQCETAAPEEHSPIPARQPTGQDGGRAKPSSPEEKNMRFAAKYSSCMTPPLLQATGPLPRPSAYTLANRAPSCSPH